MQTKIESRDLLPPGEGGPKGRMRQDISGGVGPSPSRQPLRLSRHPLPEGEGRFEHFCTLVQNL
jgi:hypothetical protein